MNKKLVIVINGSGGAGKDSVVHIVAEQYRVWNVSSIDPIKEAAEHCGVDSLEFHTDRGRKLLSDLKRLFIEYNNYPTMYLLSVLYNFVHNEYKDIMFVHIREPEEIDKFINAINQDVRIVTLFIKNRNEKIFGNVSDDDVENYEYDYVYENTGPLSLLKNDFMKFFKEKILGEIL